MDDTGSDATEYGGRYSGFDPQSQFYTSPGSHGNPSTDEFDLTSLFNQGMDTWNKYKPNFGSFNNVNEVGEGINQQSMSLPQQGQQEDPNQGVSGFFQPGSTGYKWGLRDPGSSSAKDFFGNETEGERNARMGLVGNTVPKLAGMFMSPVQSLAMGIGKGYNNYQKTGDGWGSVATALGGTSGPLGAIGSLAKGDYGTATSKMIPGLGGQVAGLGVDAALGGDVTQPAATLAARYAGNQLGGPIGGMLAGGMAKAALAPDQPQQQGQPNGMMKTAWNPEQFIPGYQKTAQQTENQPKQIQEEYSPVKGVLGGLGSLFLGNDAYNSMGGSADGIRQQQQMLQQQQASMPSLESMYGANSPYALQMRQKLERMDAKAGRNSQYGPREAQLQALLADKGSQYASAQAAANQGYAKEYGSLNDRLNQSNMAQQQIRAQQLGGMYDIGKGLGINKAVQNGLGSLYDNYAPQVYNWFKGNSPQQDQTTIYQPEEYA
jgi:hypothetical protein